MIPPSLATTILDTDVGEQWLDAVADFERRMVIAKSRLRVKAARDLGDVIEGLRIVVRNHTIVWSGSIDILRWQRNFVRFSWLCSNQSAIV